MKIKLRDVKKKYGKFEAIKGVSLEFASGRFYGLLGPNGAGKTTIFNLLIQAIEQTSGEIAWEVDGKRIVQAELYQHVGVVFQSSRLDQALTVEENLVTRGALYGLSKRDVLQKIDEFEPFLHINALKKQKYKDLSGGQKRKIDIVRALLPNPAILLLDEPTTGLDPKARNDLWQAIYDLNKKAQMTVVLITHYLEEMAFCDTLNVLINGRVYYSGEVDTFIAQNSQMNLILNLYDDKRVDGLHAMLAEKRESVTETKIVYRDVTMNEVMDIIAHNNPLRVIKDFEVEYASLEVAYLNVLARMQEGEK